MTTSYSEAAYEIRFTRYDRATCERRLSDTRYIHADDFREAFAAASYILSGMTEADPAREYEIITVHRPGYTGTKCAAGGKLWETQAEKVARVEKATS